MSTTTIYPAKRIITMNPNRPVVEAVAVRDGRILGAGSVKELQTWGDFEVDDRFIDKFILPGFVEGHCHVSAGSLWRFAYVGSHSCTGPNGKIWSPVKCLEDLIVRIREATPDKPTAYVGWGFNPASLTGFSCSRQDLDRVSLEYPVVVLHASLHIASVNTKALEIAGYLRQGIDHEGIPLGPDGLPMGELRGPDAMHRVTEFLGLNGLMLSADEQGIRTFGQLCVRNGVTTAADLANPLDADATNALLRIGNEEDYPVRIVSMLRLLNASPEGVVRRAVELRDLGSDQIRFGFIKLVLDGSLQGFTARLRWPGHYNGAPSGMWYTAPEQITEILSRALEAGVGVHIHTNGDAATELALDCMQVALKKSPCLGHRFTIQHAQLATQAQFARMRELGLCVNLFVNHIYHWGEFHRKETLGPERAERMDACASALAERVPLAIHSDAPVTPLSPLFTAWCAVNRVTDAGRVLGEAQRISVHQALSAITLGAAYTLNLDGECGSIESGKRADLAILSEDPTEVEPMGLKDVGVVGTVQNGRVFLN